MLQTVSPKLVLASASTTRRRLLGAAGLRFEAVSAGIEEGAVKREAAMLDADAPATALRLASLKAQAVERPGALVIGCDQILVCDGVWFDKPPTRDIARAQLVSLRGRSHTLATACIALREGVEVWRHAASPRLTMRRSVEGDHAAILGLPMLPLLGFLRSCNIIGA